MAYPFHPGYRPGISRHVSRRKARIQPHDSDRNRSHKPDLRKYLTIAVRCAGNVSVQGGRSSLRHVLFQAGLVATCHNPSSFESCGKANRQRHRQNISLIGKVGDEAHHGGRITVLRRDMATRKLSARILCADDIGSSVTADMVCMCRHYDNIRTCVIKTTVCSRILYQYLKIGRISLIHIHIVSIFSLYIKDIMKICFASE